MVGRLDVVDTPRSLRELPPFPSIALKILGLLAEEESETKEIVETIASDPVFASEALHLANSPLFGVPRRIKSVNLAVVVLGRDRLRSVTMSVALRSYAKGPRKHEMFPDWWRHSLAAALLAEGLAVACSAHSEYAYTAGLVHSIGRLGLMTISSAAYERVARCAAGEPGGTLAMERKLFGLDHCGAGRIMMEEWRFPPELVVPATTHHGEPVPGAPTLEGFVRLGCRLAGALGFTSMPGEYAGELSEIAEALPEPFRGQLELDPATIAAALRARIEAIAATPV